jgi:hypothetical protein
MVNQGEEEAMEEERKRRRKRENGDTPWVPVGCPLSAASFVIAGVHEGPRTLNWPHEHPGSPDTLPADITRILKGRERSLRDVS